VGEHPPVPTRWDTVPGDPTTMIAATREAARADDWASVPGSMAAVIRNVLEIESPAGAGTLVAATLPVSAG
jgi:hypothetical protein